MSVLIIGAGISGLSGAYNLIAATEKTDFLPDLTVWEARDEVGGRTRNTPFDFPLDMGAQDMFFGDIAQYEALLKGGDSLSKGPFRFQFDWDPESRITYKDCPDRDSCPGSTSTFPRDDDGLTSFKTRSLASFVDYFFYQKRDKENQPVSRKTQTGKKAIEINTKTHEGKVHVTAEGGSTIVVDQVVVAVPVSTLKARNITFVTEDDPADWLKEIDRVFTSKGSRVFAEFNKAKSGVDVINIGDRNQIYWDATRGKTRNSNPKPDDRNIITNQGNKGIYTNDRAGNVADGAAAERQFMADVEKVYGLGRGDLVDPRQLGLPSNPFVIDWGKEKHIEMINSAVPGNLNFEQLFTPIDGKVWFAGDYMEDKGRFGNLENIAAESGGLAAKNALGRLCDSDDLTWRFTNPKGRRVLFKNCRWVAKNPKQIARKCKYSGSVVGPAGDRANVTAKDACRKACNSCEGLQS